MKVAFFDIETTDLAADVGQILCVSVLPWRGRVKTFKGTGGNPLGRSDRGVVKATLEELMKYDLLVSYYGRFFDVPYLRSKAMLHRIRTPFSFLHIDLHLTTKQGLRLSNNRLVTCESFLGLQNNKTPLTRKVWKEAEYGDPKAFAEVVRHCEADVLVLQEYYERMLPLVKNVSRVVF